MRRLLTCLSVLAIASASCGADTEPTAVDSPTSEARVEPTSEVDPDVETTTSASEDWDPILTTTRAGDPPAAATCPAQTDPDAPGPADQDRPEPGWVANAAATFDAHLGRIVFVDIEGETWTFDVCTNTWYRMNPTGQPLGEGASLVYDVDSDVTIAVGFEGVAAYDANTNTWARLDNDAATPVIEQLQRGTVVHSGSVYDPVSGLVLVRLEVEDRVQLGHFRSELWAFDVDTNRWEEVGEVPEPGFLIGYLADRDLLVFQLYATAINPSGAILDPRTGEAATILGDDPRMVGGFGSYLAGSDSHTAWVYSDHYEICRLSPETVEWKTCLDVPPGPVVTNVAYSAIVGDPLNDRLVLINGIFGNWWANSTDEIWAVDPTTDTWTQLLPPTT